MAKIGVVTGLSSLATQCPTAAGGYKARWDPQSQGWVLVTFHSCKTNSPLGEAPRPSSSVLGVQCRQVRNARAAKTLQVCL